MTVTETRPRTGIARRAYVQLQLFMRAPHRPDPQPNPEPLEPSEPAPPTGVTVPPLTREQVNVIVEHDLRHRRFAMFGDHVSYHTSRHVPATAQLLDEVRPRWFAEVDLTVLDLTSPTRCVLGQLYPSFSRGTYELESYLAARHRETLPLHHATSGTASTNVWVAEIMNRRVADAARAGTRVTG